MNKLKFGLLFFTSGIFFNGFAQLNDFDLSKYVLPDLERRALETNFNINGINSYNEAPYTTKYGFEEYAYNQYYSDINLNYNHYLNNSEFQRESNIGFDFLSSFSNRKEDKELLSKRSDITPLLYYQLDNRKYHNQNSFFETDLILNYQYGKYKRYNKSSWDGSEREDIVQTHTVLAYTSLKTGNGRIEQVQDARHAIYIFEELSKIERITSSITDDQIIEFARLISQLKNRRFFDFRLRRIAELESIDAFLMLNNYISEQDAKYFTTLSDFWAYGNRPFRNSGTRFSGTLRPGYYYYNYDNSGDGLYFNTGKYSLSALMIDGGIELKHEKPINLLWQNSIDLNGYVGIIDGTLNDKTNSIESKLRIPNIQLGFYQTIGYYPNTRTAISFRYSVQYVQLFDATDYENRIIGVEGKGAKAATDLSINYYISPKFRLNAISSFYFIWQDSEDEVIINFDNVAGSNILLNNFTSIPNGYMDYFKVNEINNRFSISLIYSIF